MRKKASAVDGERIKKARQNSGLTQNELAIKMGVSQALVSNWEKDKIKPSPTDTKKLFSIFGISFDDKKIGEQKELDEEVSAIGAWLSKTRIGKNLTPFELASLSGVGTATIYAIEKGRSKNPREATLGQLEKALNETVPQELKEEIKEDSTIEGLGEMLDFNPYDTKSLPEVPGVYVFYDISNRPIYVGKAGKIRARVSQHSDKFWFKYPIVNQGTFIQIEDEKLRGQIEKILIKFMKDNAVINKQNVERDSDEE